MAAWKNLSARQIETLRATLVNGLDERGISELNIKFDPSGLAGRYRLYVISPDFEKLDFSERLNIVSETMRESWPRHDQLRITLLLPLSPSEVPAEVNGRKERSGQPRPRRRSA